ncbi:MAG: hypothetical protein V9H26_09950 [Verrucomicrobiota bacterium]
MSGLQADGAGTLPELEHAGGPDVSSAKSRQTAGGGWTNVGGPRFAAGTGDSIYVGGGSAGFYRIVRLR